MVQLITVLSVLFIVWFFKYSQGVKLKRIAENKANDLKNTIIRNRREALIVAENILSIFHSVQKESAVVLYLNEENLCIDSESYFGDSRSVNVPPIELVEKAHQIGANKLIIMHNHPNNSAVPSDADVSHSASVHLLLSEHNIALIDNIVWCRGSCKSVLNTLRFKQMIKPY